MPAIESAQDLSVKADRSSYNANPSAFRHRLPVLLLAAVGCGIASYLALYQLGVLAQVWEPLFGKGSQEVLHSFVSRLLPVPDAALGAAGYAAELIGGMIGGTERSQTQPGLVVAYGFVVAFVTLTAVLLVIVQVFVIRAGCTLCLTSAAISLVIAGLARREVFAALHHWRK